jgi:hypothetical protein
MPFTLAHPAAVMPLRRLKYLPVPALVVGSMAPDIPYYFPGSFERAVGETHSLYGSIVRDIPMGIIVIALVLLLRGPLTALMTERARWASLREADRFMSSPLNWLLSIPAVLIGTWTHIVWDGFTHPGTWLSRRVDALSAPVNLFGVYTGVVSHVLQYASSVVGLAVIVYWYTLVAVEAPAEVTNSSDRSVVRWLLLLLAGAAAVGMGALTVFKVHQGPLTVYHMFYLLLTRTVAWFMLLYVAAGAVVLWTRRPQPQLQA